ncbi:MAG: GAF domain-containing sensor histidine kinase [bacterium]
MTEPNKFNITQHEYLIDIITKTLTSDNLDEAIRNISLELGKLFNADRVHFRFYDDNLETFSAVIEEYRKNENVASAKGKMIYPKEFDVYLKEKLDIQDHIFILDDINRPEYSDLFKELFNSLNIKNEIVLPIYYKNKLESAFFITNTESSEFISEENLDFLIPIARQISIGTHLFKINNLLNKKAEYDKILREAVINVRLYDNPEDVFIYLVNKLSDLFNVNMVLNLNIDTYENYIVLYEALKNDKEQLKGKLLFSSETFRMLEHSDKSSIIVVNDIKEIENNELQNLLSGNQIKAFMLYPIEEILPIKGEKKIKERIMVCSDIPRKWSYQDIEALKLIIGTISIIYIDIINRKEISEIEETFIASLVHDLKSPIYAEQKGLEFIISRKPDTTLSKVSPYLIDMYNTNEELLRLITNLLTVYSMELGQHELKKEPANINKIIDDSIRTIKALAEDNEDSITKNIQENLCDIYIDPDEIKRVITNLISNAIKHNAKGIEIDVIAEKKENEILISIKDNGSGISEKEKANIFQKYKTTKSKVGTGLGLYLSKQIVEHHNGKIWFESEEGKGTTFNFKLPLTDSDGE